MNDITRKATSLRKAVATAIVKVSKQETIDAVQNKQVPKGDVFEFSRAAGLLAIKKTSDVIPDCHPLPIEYASIKHTINELQIVIEVEVHTIYRTGVEVEAIDHPAMHIGLLQVAAWIAANNRLRQRLFADGRRHEDLVAPDDGR